MNEWPIIHAERCDAREVQFTNEHAMIHLADERIMGVPLAWFPPIQRATNEQRRNHTCYGDTIHWHDVDDGIDLTAMLTGLYIVQVSQRNSRSEPHVPITWLYLDGGARRSGDIEGVPFVQDTRNFPQDIRFEDDNLIFDLADGRILCMPASFAPRLAKANDSQRMDFQRTGLTLRWEDLDEDINLIAMLTGFYDLDKPPPEPAVEKAEAPTT